VTIVLTLVALVVGLTALFWGMAMFIQPFIYEQVVDKLPLRAALAGMVMGGFLAGWVSINTRSEPKNKYGGLHDFSSTTIVNIDEFDAIRQLGVKDESGKPKEITVRYKWRPDAGGRFVDKDSEKEFKLNDAVSMTVAIVVPDQNGRTARFNAEIGTKDGKDKGKYVVTNDERRFLEEGGSRYIDGRKPRDVIVPSTGTFIIVVLINLLHLVLWIVVFWPILRFNLGTSLLIALGFTLIFMLGIMPLLFDLNTIKPVLAKA
jgi:hypothetical protein